MVVSLDQNRITRVDGRPFFLIGARHMPEGGTPEILADAGFNGYRWLAFGTESACDDLQLPRADEPLFFWAYIYDRAVFSRGEGHRRQLEDLVRRVKDHPRLFCYENFNEVALRWRHIDRKAQPAELAEGTAYLRELDPDHAIWLAHSCDRTVEALREYDECMDVVGCNPYPVIPPGLRQHMGVRPDGRMLDCPDQTPHAVGRYTEKMMAVGEGRMPVWMLIQAMANENWFSTEHCPEMAGQTADASKILYPTYEQMRFMAYDAIIAGATGLAFSMYKTPIESQAWQDVSQVVDELSRLHDALAAPPVEMPIEMSYTDLGFSIWDGVKTLVRRKGTDLYLFAANTAFDPAQVTMRMPSVGGASAATVEGEDREVSIENGTMTDSFDPYGVHVYRIANK